MDFKEKRAHQRVDASIDIKIRYSKGTVPSKLKNISKAGAAIETPLELPAGDKMIEMVIPLPGGLEIAVNSEIARRESRGEAWIYGLKFENLGKNLQLHLIHLINHLLTHPSDPRRKHTRVARRIPLKYHKFGDLEALLENISMGGVSMLVDTPHLMYEDIDIAIPDLSGREFLILRGKLVHQKAVIHDGRELYKVGLEFNELSNAEKACLHGLILHILDTKGADGPI